MTIVGALDVRVHVLAGFGDWLEGRLEVSIR